MRYSKNYNVLGGVTHIIIADRPAFVHSQNSQTSQKHTFNFIYFAQSQSPICNQAFSKKGGSSSNSASNSARLIFSFCRSRFAQLWSTSIFSRMSSVALA